jgi:regulator of sigma E protease
VHELGHFLAAKGFGVWVRRFAIGFGPAIVKWRRGGPLPADGMPPADDPSRYATEYSLRILPLGGFVDPMGEHPEAEGGDDPRALWRRPAWQKAVVFSAGVAMNAVLAVVFFTAASLVGLEAPSPLVGAVTPMSPADKAGIKAGDRVVAINGTPVQSFEDIVPIVMSQDAGSRFSVTVERPINGSDRMTRLTFDGLVSQRDSGDMAPRLGLEPAIEPVIYGMIPNTPEEQAGLRVGDRIVAIDGKHVQHWGQMEQLLASAPAGPITISVQRQDKRLDLAVDPSKLTQYDDGMEPVLTIGSVDPDGPAAQAGLRKGDRIVSVNGKAWPTAKELIETTKAAGNGGKVRLVLERRRQSLWDRLAGWWVGAPDEENLDVTVAAAIYGHPPDPRMGIRLEPGIGKPVQIGQVEPGGAAAKAGIRPGDTIVAIADKPVKSWIDVQSLLYKADSKPLPIRLERDGREVTETFVAAAKPIERFAFFGSRQGSALYEPMPRIYNPIVAMAAGLKRTYTWVGWVYANLRQLSKREVGPESVGGPVMIVDISLRFASHGLGTFLNLWGILSVCIAVFNFLPVPPFDGGHVLFVLLEKVKGSPVGIKVRTWIWGAGWAAVAVLFAFIMWQDISRLL